MRTCVRKQKRAARSQKTRLGKMLRRRSRSGSSAKREAGTRHLYQSGRTFRRMVYGLYRHRRRPVGNRCDKKSGHASGRHRKESPRRRYPCRRYDGAFSRLSYFKAVLNDRRRNALRIAIRRYPRIDVSFRNGKAPRFFPLHQRQTAVIHAKSSARS